MKAFLDTNILIDLVCSRDPFLQDAQNLFAECVTGRLDLCVSALSFVNTILYRQEIWFY